MNEPHVHEEKQIYLQLDNALQFRLSRIKEIKHFYNVEIHDREKMSKTLNKHIAVLTGIYLFCQVQEVVSLFVHFLLFLVYL